jgi:hypothetical protein
VARRNEIEQMTTTMKARTNAHETKSMLSQRTELTFMQVRARVRRGVRDVASAAWRAVQRVRACARACSPRGDGRP